MDRPITNGWMLTRNFWLFEFEEPGSHLVKLHPMLAIELQRLRDFIGKPIRITSGYRGHEHNAAVGGVPDSAHIYGEAADFVVDPDREDLVMQYLDGSSVFDWHHEPDHFHVEIREHMRAPR